MDHVISSCIHQMIKKLKRKIFKFVFLLTRILATGWGRSWHVVSFAHWDRAAKEWACLVPQDLPPHSELLVPLGVIFPAFSTHPPAVSRRGAAQALLPVSCRVESLSCLYWTWREERPVVSSVTSKRRKLLSSVSKFATSLGFCSNKERILDAFSKGIKPFFFPFSFHCCIFFFFLCIFDQLGPSVMSTGLILPDAAFLLTPVAAEESLNLGWE